MDLDTSESNRKRGKNFNIRQDRQVCLSWIHAKRQEELGDNAPADEIRSDPFNVWDTLYEHAVHNDPNFEKRSVDGLRHRFTLLQRQVRRFAECYTVAMREEGDPDKTFANAMQHYSEVYKGQFRFLCCYRILRKHPKFHDMPEINPSIALEKMTANRDDEECEPVSTGNSNDASECNRKQGTRGRNFTAEHDVQICLSWLYAKKDEELGRNTFQLEPFNVWTALRHHAATKNPDFNHRSDLSLRSRFFKIQHLVKNFFELYNEVVQDENDTEMVLALAMQRYMDKYKEDFKFLDCFHLFQKHPIMQKQLDAVYATTSKLQDNLDSDDQGTSIVPDVVPPLGLFTSEDLTQAMTTSFNEDKHQPVAQEKSDGERAPLRGKNFTASQDRQLCLAWIDAKEAKSLFDSASSKPCGFWQTVYNNAVSKDSSFVVRAPKGLKCRMHVILKYTRQFADCYNMFVPLKQQTDTEKSVLQRAMQSYKVKYSQPFKFVHCWLILKQHSIFCAMAEDVSASQSDISKPDQEDEALSNNCKTTLRIIIRRDEIQALLKACYDIGVEEVRSRGKPIEPLFYDVQQQMAAYGKFTKRRLPMLKHMYDKTKREYKDDQLEPYPPEARILWGSRGTSEEEQANDLHWERLIQSSLDNKTGSSFLSSSEIKELLKQAIKNKVESDPNSERIFYRMLKNMQSQKLCRRKDIDQLMEDYHRLKRLFLSGSSKSLPPEATQLWNSGPSDDCDEQKIEPIEHIDFAECNMKVETDFCRICQAQLLDQSKDLFFDAHNAQTYADIIQETLNVKMINDGLQSNFLCDSCAGFIASLVTFVQQCRNSCGALEVTKDIAATTSGFTKLELEASDTNIEFLDEEASNCTAFDFPGFDDNFDPEDDNMEIDSKVNLEETKLAEVAPSVDHCEDISESNLDVPTPMDLQAEDNAVTDPAESTVTVTSTAPPGDGTSGDNPKVETTRKKLVYRKLNRTRREKNKVNKKQCHFCGVRVNDIARHIESHEETNYQCTFCDRVCPNRKQLRIHMNRHTKEREFPCRYCGKIFYVWSSRKNHIKNMHEEERFQCDMCDAVYKFKSYLQQHKKFVHLGIRDLKCTKCDFSTSIKTRLLNHFRSIHTSERPYKCTVCDHQSNSNTGYYIHFQRHKKSGEATSYTIKCAYCAEIFDKDRSLEVHIVKVHPDRAVLI